MGTAQVHTKYVCSCSAKHLSYTLLVYVIDCVLFQNCLARIQETFDNNSVMEQSRRVIVCESDSEDDDKLTPPTADDTDGHGNE